MGLGGLEPPTSRLSGVRSNQLSYRPLKTAALALYFVVTQNAVLSVLAYASASIFRTPRLNPNPLVLRKSLFNWFTSFVPLDCKDQSDDPSKLNNNANGVNPQQLQQLHLSLKRR